MFERKIGDIWEDERGNKVKKSTKQTKIDKIYTAVHLILAFGKHVILSIS